MELKLGKTIELHGLRIHRYATSINCTNLENANKRGKLCKKLAVYSTYLSNDQELIVFSSLASMIVECQTSEAIEKIMSTFHIGVDGLKLQESEERGVDVAPSEEVFKPLKFETDSIRVSLEWDSFSIRDKNDKYNESTIISNGSGSNARKLHKVWEKSFQGLDIKFSDIHTWLVNQDDGKNKIKFHYYCAMD